MYAGHGCGNCVCGRPRRFQEVEADLAGLEVDVWMADGRDEADFRRAERVLRRNADVKEPAAAYINIIY